MIKTDVLIIGSGIAALSVASELCKYKNKKITIITKGPIKACNSSLAQGGISVALSDKDDYHWHYEDTMEAGCNINDADAVMKLVSTAPQVILDFIKTGMVFDKDSDGNLAFGREGAHRLNRIIHAGGDRTGLRVVEQLLRTITPDVTIIQNEMALDLRVKNGKCSGVITRNSKTGEINYYTADYTVLATGGIGQLYPSTSNDITITGDGIAMAYRAGCKLKNLEFVQFHPTMLTIDGKAYGLVSEAVRGAGGILVNDKGEKIMEGVHPQKDLAPRDVVSREVYAHYLKGEKIYLDISAVKDFRAKFPTVTEICEEHGVNVDDKLLPVAPGAHFHMGGVEAAPEGITNIEGLYAVGEVACTGVHGANRLASNSLLEGLVFGKLLADYIEKTPQKADEIFDENSSLLLSSLPEKAEIQSQMMNFVGIVRHSGQIHKIIDWFEKYSPDKNFGKISIEQNTNEQFEIYNMLTTGWLVAKSAESRKYSIGAHYIVKD